MPIRVLVVEDSLTVRKRICEALSFDPDIEVVGEAQDGRQGIELCEKLRPDVITVDMLMPVMSGLAVTEYVMAHFPTPILVVSSSTNRGDLFKTYDALAAGALDVLEKPKDDESDAEWEQRLVSTVKLIARIRVITHLRARLGLGSAATPSTIPAPAPVRARGIVAIGASTGGPAALREVLRAIPRDPKTTIFVVLHIDEPFGSSFAEWLADQTRHTVRHARNGDALASAAGTVTMPPPGSHLIVRGDRLLLTKDPPRHSCRPSIDVLFESLAAERGADTVAVLLTGMGRDGAQGLLELRRAGGLTIAQDEASCIVYGMPREAARLGAAERILPLSEIGPAVAARTSGGRAR